MTGDTVTRAEAIQTIKSVIEYVDTGRCPSCGWHGCRDYVRCTECDQSDNSAWGIEHLPTCTVAKLVSEFGEDILDEAL